jgi:hypothetical protein
MQLIAERGDGQYLLVTRGKPESPKALGRIFNNETGVIGTELLVQSILARGYWHEPTIDARVVQSAARDALRRQSAS